MSTTCGENKNEKEIYHDQPLIIMQLWVTFCSCLAILCDGLHALLIPDTRMLTSDRPRVHLSEFTCTVMFR
jgi:hypothetical protein